MEINYSFIIPHKNCPDLLNRCLDSIPQREDIQIIVVDDNSDDGKKPSVNRKDVEVVLLDAEHSKGAGRARNVGLEKATGKWLLFADADDYYTDYLPKILDKYITDDKTDIVYLNANEFDESGDIHPLAIKRLISKYLNHKYYSEMELRYGYWTPWSRMIKRHVVEENKLKFDEIPAGNDIIFCLNCSRCSSNISAEIDIVYLYYRPNKGSVTDRARKGMIEERLELRGRMINLQKSVGYKLHATYTGLYVTFVTKLGMPKLYSYKMCIKYLNKYNMSLVSDIGQYLKLRIVKKICDKII